MTQSLIGHADLGGLARHKEISQHRRDHRKGGNRQRPFHDSDKLGVTQRFQSRGAGPCRPVMTMECAAGFLGHPSPTRRQSWIWRMPTGFLLPVGKTKRRVIFLSFMKARASAASWSGRAILGFLVITARALRSRKLSPSM